MNGQLRKHYRVFVASPGDVSEERDRVSQVIQQVNSTIASELGIHLEVWKWESDAAPDAGEPQDLINPEVDRADIVVAILWNRLGTPTRHADSGTVEEITRALERWREKKSPRLMIYFCERPAFLKTAREKEQSLLVSTFRENISAKVLAQAYESTADFEKRLLRDLSRVCKDLIKGEAQPEIKSTTVATPNLVSYLEHIRNVCGSIVLTGLLRERAAPAVPLDEVYVSLTVTRTDLGSEASSSTSSGRAVASLAAFLRQQKQLPELMSLEARSLLEEALGELGVPQAEVRESYTTEGAYKRLRASGDKDEILRFSSQSVRETLRTFDVEDAFQHAHCLLVEGAPGSGKTTILMRVAMALAKAHQGDDASAREMGFKDPYPLPIFVPLRHFWTYRRSLPPSERIFSSVRLLLNYLHAALSQYINDVSWLDSYLKLGQVALLFDGLDEVPDEVGRQQTSAIVRDFVSQYPNCRLALTTRPAGLTTAIRNNLVTQGRLAYCEMRPLDQEQIARFIRVWYRALVTNPTESERKAQELVKRIGANPRVSDLASTPILLTAIAVVHQSRGDLPERRADLYDHCVKALCGRWDAAKDEEGRQLTGEYAEDTKLSLLQEIAFKIHDQGGDARTIERGPLLELLTDRLHLDSRQPQTKEKYTILLEYMVDRTGLIIPEGETNYRFRHLSFQEFLAARHICDRVDDAVEELAPRLADPWWREVIQLAPAYKALNSIADARRLMANLAKHAREQANAESLASAFGTIARALLDLREYNVDRLEETVNEIKPDFLRVLDDPSQPGQTRVRAEIGECIGQFGDPRLTNENRWITIAAGEYWRGLSGADGVAEQTRDDHGHDQVNLPLLADEATRGTAGGNDSWIQISQFRIQRWPVTVSEYLLFIDDGGYSRSQWWEEGGWEWLRGESIATPDRWESQIDKGGNNPVVGLSWWEASAFCRWYSTLKNGLPNGWHVRLPTEAEWEKAARGGRDLANGSMNGAPKREYPWVGDWCESCANSGEGDWLGTAVPVGCFPKGNGPYGTWDQSGNIWEWCLDWHDPQAYFRAGRVDPAVVDSKGVAKVFVVNNRGQKVLAPCRVTKGGSWTADKERALISFRNRLEPSKRFDDQGFRCASVPKPTRTT